MRSLALVALVAACSNDPGLLLDIHASSSDVVEIEVFLPDAAAGDGMTLPPGGAAAAAKMPGTIYTVIDRVHATAAGGTATILLQPGSRHDVPALLVLGYNANHEPIADAVVTDASGSLKLPASGTVELKVTLDPATYTAPDKLGSGGGTIARWSSAAPDGDPNGPCIAVAGQTHAFFSVAGDLDCDAEKPDCDDTSFDYVGSGAPANALCAAQQLYPQTMDACTVGTTVACTDGVGTCGPRVASPGGTATPICVPRTLCDHCKNSNSTTGTSGIDAACEAAARTDPNTIRIDCQLLAMRGASAGMVSPCTDTGRPMDMTGLLGQGWGCLGTSMSFFTSYGLMAPSSFVTVGGTPADPDYRIDPHCGGGPVAFSFTGGANTTFPEEPNTDVLALFTFPLHGPNTTTPVSQLAIPFRMSYVLTDVCPPLDMPALTCVFTAPSGDPADDPIWKGCAGAP